MPRRKYTRGKEEPKGWECCNRKCKWQGQDEEKGERKIDSSHTILICPQCGKDDFYGLLEKPVSKVELELEQVLLEKATDIIAKSTIESEKALSKFEAAIASAVAK